MSFEKDSWIWYNHPQDTWIPAQVQSINGNEVTVVTQRGEEYKGDSTSEGTFMPLHESSLTDVPDMVQLGDMNDAALLHNLRIRFVADDIFTYIGPILVACNPYKRIPIYGPEFVEKYFTSIPGATLPPHVYNLANNAYRQMMENKLNQSVVISGESGAGKTEETKLCLNYLAEIAGNKEEGVVGKEQLLLDCSPILEAFGNAKTVRNNNSSRFGKYLQIDFDSAGKICGGSTIHYLLEKSRIVKLGKGERNYHIWYQLMLCLDPDQRNKYFEDKTPMDFFYMQQSGIDYFEGNKDAVEYADVEASWEALGIRGQELEEIYGMTAAVQWIGAVTFDGDDDEESCDVADQDIVEKAAELLSIENADLMATTMTYRNMQSGGRSIVVIDLGKTEAANARDGMAKAVYGRLFDWLVARLNEVIKVDEGINTEASLGVLDIFGFEIFEVNSFEQLCINLANEKLQYHFNGHIFKLELDIYEKEGLDVAGISFEDNQACLDLLEKKPKGVLPMLDEECVVPKGSDETLLKKLEDTHRKNPNFSRPKKGKNKMCFAINHYAGEVAYSTFMFLSKNRDMLQPDIQNFLSASDSSLIQSLFPPYKAKKGRQATLGGQFKSSLNALYNKLMSTEPHFIKCVKSNQVKQAGVFDSVYTLGQLQYLGLMEVIRIRVSGFPVRRAPEDFYHRYKLLSEGATNAESLAKDIGNDGEWQMGKTLLFMKDSMQLELEKQRGEALDITLRSIQSFLKSELARTSFLKLRDGFTMFQAVVRGSQDRENFERMLAIKGVEEALDAAIKAREKSLLDTALTNANALSYSGALVNQASKLLVVVEKEVKVFHMLKDAIAEEKEDALKIAISEAKNLKLKDNLVNTAELLLDSMKNKKSKEKRKQALSKVQEELDSAINMDADSDPEAKFNALTLALSNAEMYNVDDEKVEEAKQQLEEIRTTIDVDESLKAASESGQKERIQAAIDIASEKGVTSSASVEAATKTLDTVNSDDKAKEDLVLAIKTKDIESLKNAINDAKSAGFKGVELSQARALLKQKENGLTDKDKKTELLEAAKSESKEWMENPDAFKLLKVKTFENLRPHANMNFSKAPLKTSLINFKSDNAYELIPQAVSTFNAILGYVGIRNMQYPDMLALEVVHNGFDEEGLRDEIYLQLIKMTKGPDLVNKRAWQLLNLCSYAFACSTELYPYLRIFFEKNFLRSKDAANATMEEIVDRTIRSFEEIVSGDTEGRIASIEEIDSLYNEEHLYVTVYFMDSSLKRYRFGEDTTAKDLVKSVCDQFDTDNPYINYETCGLYDETNFKDPKYIEPTTKIFDLVTNWQSKMERSLSSKLALKKATSHKVLFKKRLFLEEMKSSALSTNPIELHLIYTEGRANVLSGKYAVQEVEALLLASLSLQIDFGDCDADKHAGGFLKSILQQYIPPQVFKLHKPKIWEKDLMKTYEQLSGFPSNVCKTNFVKVCEKSPTYGYTLFTVKQTHIQKAPKTLFLGVNGMGIQLFRTDDKQPITPKESLSFQAISGWSHSTTPDLVNITVGKTKLNFHTDQGVEICSILKEYAHLIVKRRETPSE